MPCAYQPIRPVMSSMWANTRGSIFASNTASSCARELRRAAVRARQSRHVLRHVPGVLPGVALGVVAAVAAGGRIERVRGTLPSRRRARMKPLCGSKAFCQLAARRMNCAAISRCAHGARHLRDGPVVDRHTRASWKPPRLPRRSARSRAACTAPGRRRARSWRCAHHRRERRLGVEAADALQVGVGDHRHRVVADHAPGLLALVRPHRQHAVGAGLLRGDAASARCRWCAAAAAPASAADAAAR